MLNSATVAASRKIQVTEWGGRVLSKIDGGIRTVKEGQVRRKRAVAGESVYQQTLFFGVVDLPCPMRILI